VPPRVGGGETEADTHREAQYGIQRCRVVDELAEPVAFATVAFGAAEQNTEEPQRDECRGRDDQGE
jgi:hypothetical protein